MKSHRLVYGAVIALIAASTACDGEKGETESEELAPAALDSRPAETSLPADPESFPEVVATVNGAEITKAELLERIAGLETGQPKTENPGTIDFFRSVLDELVGVELLYQASQEEGLQADPAAVQQQLDGLRGRFPDPSLFEQALAQQGLTQKRLEAQIERGLSIQNFIEKDVSPRVSVTEDEKKKFYADNEDQMRGPDELRLSHILKRVAPDATPEDKDKARAAIEALLQKARDGEDFAALARENSDDPGSAQNGGELVIRRGQTVPPFEAAAFALEPGGLSPVVETQFGFHIIKMKEKIEGQLVPYEQVQARIEEFLRGQALQAEVERAVESLKQKASIEIFI